MWYVKNEFSDEVFYKSNDVRKTQDFVSRYNNNFKFSSQRYFQFNISTFCGPFGYIYADKVDINFFTQSKGLFTEFKFLHPLAVKDYHKRHVLYRKLKFNLILRLCKKYHVWSYNGNGRKCDGFDF